MTREVRDLVLEEARRAKLDEVTAEYLSRVITEPTLVVIEDAHWMDEASVDLLRAVSLRITGCPGSSASAAATRRPVSCSPRPRGAARSRSPRSHRTPGGS